MVCFEHLDPNIVVVVMLVGGIGARRKYVWNGASIEKSPQTLVIKELFLFGRQVVYFLIYTCRSTNLVAYV